MTKLLDAGRSVLAAQPFSRLVGAELTALDADRVVLELAIRDDLKQQNGFVHGGILSYLADNALTFAAATTLGPGLVTVEMKINYLRPALGERLIARATLLSGGRTLAVTRCDVFAVRDGDERLCAAAQATIARIAKEEVAA